MRKWEIKIIIPFRSVPTRYVIENSKQIAKKFKKIKNTVVASFQLKMGRKRLRKRENKNYPSVPFLPDAWKKIPKKGKKIQKIKKYHCGFISSEDRQEKAAKKIK